MEGVDLSIVDSIFGSGNGKMNGAAQPARPAPAASSAGDDIPDDPSPIEPIATAPDSGDPDVAEPPADEDRAAREVATRLKVPPYLDMSKLPPEQAMLIKHHLEQLHAKEIEVKAKEQKAGDALEHADLVKLIRDDPEANQMMRDFLDRRRAAMAQQAAGQPHQPVVQMGGLPEVREEFAGLGDDQLAVIERMEQRSAAREQAIQQRVRDTVVQLLQHVVGPIRKQQADAEAGRQLAAFTGAVPDWNRYASPESLKQRQAGAPHVPLNEHFFAAAGPKLYAENQQLKRKMTELLSGNRPSPPRVTTSRRQSVEPAVDPNDWGTAFDSIWRSVEGGA